MRRRGLGRRGPGLLGTMARTAVVAGTASAVAGGVAERQRDAAQRAAAPAPAAAGEVIAQLTQLGELRAAGVLTEEEFAAQKARVLGT